MGLVLDASAALSWCFRDEHTPSSLRLMHDIERDGAYVPSIWRLEVASGLWVGVRRKRITRKEYHEILQDLEKVPVTTDPDTNRYAWSTTNRLVERYNLTPYDASYLELAQRTNRSLATLDNALRQAAIDLGVVLYQL